ncbi:Peptidase family M3 [uncultured archaeon]|nr:Peptidase family M3 [uncultured archaeon]
MFKRFDDYYATIQRQAFFTIFEKSAHDKIVDGAVTDDISGVYRSTLNEQFNGSVDVAKEFDFEWALIPHIYHSPFYCYSYSFGNLLALAMFQRYKEEGTAFAKDYEAILAAGGSQNPQKLLEKHGIDISSSKSWDSGFDYIKQQLHMLKKHNV